MGHILILYGVTVDPKKTKSIGKCQLPTNIKELQIFLNICNYYAKLVPQYTHIATPLYYLIQKNIKFDWTMDYDTAFNQLKHA